VRPVQPDDASAIVDLLNTVFGYWGDGDYWRWKYHGPPAPCRLPSAVADLNGQIVGHFGIVPLFAVLDGKQVGGAQTVDAAVLPAYRRRGIHSALGRYVLDHAAQAGAVWIYAFPGLFSLAVDQRLGYRPVAFLPEMVRVLQPRQALTLAIRLLPGDIRALWTARRKPAWPPETIRRLARLRRSLLVLASWITDPAIGRSGKPQTLRATPHDPAQGFDARFDVLWAHVRSGNKLGVWKDADYLTWRYGLNPQQCYKAFVTKDEDELTGLIIIRHRGKRSDITELLSLPGRRDIVSSLLAAASDQAKRAGSITLTAWASTGHPHHDSLRRAGFVSQSRLHRLCGHFPALSRWFYRVIDYAQHLPPEQRSRLAAYAEASSLTMGDSDLV